jgi:hypothetical protein
MFYLQDRTPVLRRAIAEPNCTHIDMDRLFGHHQCQLCLIFPAVGWVYVCRQDSYQQGTAMSVPTKTPVELELNNQSPLRAELQTIGLSNSVIEAAEKDFYTLEQLDILKLQKLHLKQVISLAVQGFSNNKCSTLITKSSENNPPVTNIDGASVSVTNNDSVNSCSVETPEHSTKKLKLKHKTQLAPPCTFKACHTCRPYYKDRIYTSFGAVFAGEIAPLTAQDAAALPIGNANVLRNIGLRQPPRKHLLTDESAEVLPGSASQFTIQTTQSERDDLSRIKQSVRNFYKLGSRSLTELLNEFQMARLRKSLKNAFHNVFRTGRESSSEGSNITLPLPGTGKHRKLDQNVGEFDLGLLKRIRSFRRRILEVARNDSMPIVEVVEGNEEDYVAETNGDSLDSSEDSSDYSAYSGLSEGSEVEVDGGVALTEEAVEMHTPDIIMQV